MDEVNNRQIDDLIIALCAARGPQKSICPSEVARAAAAKGEDWRALMENVRKRAAALATDGRIIVTQKGRPVDPQDARGPIRLTVASRERP